MDWGPGFSRVITVNKGNSDLSGYLSVANRMGVELVDAVHDKTIFITSFPSVSLYLGITGHSQSLCDADVGSVESMDDAWRRVDSF